MNKKPKKALVPKQKKKKEKQPTGAGVKVPTVIADEAIDADPEAVLELFGDVPPTPSELGKKLPMFRPLLAVHCKVLGYILLSKPATVNSPEPLMVGCVIYNAKQ